jgi:hypothetical protein
MGMNQSRQLSTLALLAWCGLSAVQAQTTASDNATDLSSKATDPTAALMSFQLADWYTASSHDSDATANQLVLRAAIPFSMAGTQNIFRVTQPVITSSPRGQSGLGDLQVFNLTVFGAPWGRWGLGLAASLPVAKKDLGSGKWTLGPAVGFVNSSLPGHSFGLFAQSFFSVAGDNGKPAVGIVNLQPLYSYQLGGGRSLSLGNSNLAYDTRQSRWASLSLGLNYGQVVGFWGHKWRPSIEVDHDFQNRAGNPKTTIRAALVLLLPA